MAKSTTRTSRSKTAARSTRTTDVEVVAEPKTGFGFEEGVAVITALLLIAAFILVDKEMGGTGFGLFFKPH